MIKVNVIRWYLDIKWTIEKWKDFRNSDLCETENDRDNADAVIDRLENMLDKLIYTRKVSEADFAWYISLL